MHQKASNCIFVAQLVETPLLDESDVPRYKRKSPGSFYALALALERIHPDDLAAYLERNEGKTMFIFMVDEKDDSVHLVISYEERIAAFAQVLGRLYRNFPILFEEFSWIPLLYDPEVILLDPDQYVAEHFSHWEDLEKQAQAMRAERLSQVTHVSMQGANEVLQSDDVIETLDTPNDAANLIQVIQQFAQGQDVSVIEGGPSSGLSRDFSITSKADLQR